MSFHLSAEDIRIDDNHILRARLRNENGDWQDAEIDLNQHIGNEDGMIHWDGVNFSHSAENVTFSIEGGGEVPVLRTFLRSRDGEEFSRDVNLAERIENHNGQFVYGMYPLVIGALQRLLLIYDQFKCYML
ncbi:hypothetical protein BHYA_0152g00250 [Botrytis hyacinthi]|uniref:Cyanovirin-N domain-containing protein n=1 Tax=Botrytis hyacinthi TaxID=278943 RepID=A0A4Z1GF90_9HELO|nr:hypothetical protein BHYA_0152g00250 [Botrytis hyacinthi]